MFPIHLILISIIPFLYLVALPDVFLFFSISIIPFFYLIGVAIFLHIVINFFLKNKLKSALVVSWLYLIFFTYGDAHSFLNNIFGDADTKNLLYSQEVAIRSSFLVPVWVGAFVLGSIWILKTKKTLVGLTRFVNVFSITMVSLSLLNLAFYFLTQDKSVFQNSSGSEVNHVDVRGSTKTPDIFYLVFDAYPNEHTLKEMFDYDNSLFINSLKKRGFYVASKSRSNYARTITSLSSLFSMNYIDQSFFETTRQLAKNSPLKDSLLWQAVEYNKVSGFLKNYGYKTINIRTGRRIGARNRSVNLEIRCDQISEIVSLLVRISLYYPFEKKFQLIGNSRRHQSLCLFDSISDIANSPSPKFVYGHVMLPHSDYIFGPNGENVINVVSKEAFLGQVTFTSKKIITMVDKILEQSDSQPIIIIQSDHGSGFPYSVSDLSPNNDVQFKRNRMRNLSAFLLPEKDNEMIYQNISNVNTFRVIFNLYFNTDYKLLEDKSYFSWEPAPFYLEEIDPYVD
jgi:hypothetical protein